MIELFGVQLGNVLVGVLALGLIAFSVGLVRAISGGGNREAGAELRDGLVRMISGAAVLVAVALGFAFAAGAPIFAGLFGGIDSLLAWVAIIVAAGVAAKYVSDLSVTFTMTFFAIVLWLASFAPDWLTRPFAFLSRALFGVQFAEELEPVPMLVLTLMAVLVYLFIRVRAAGNAKRPSSVANRMETQLRRLVREYAAVFRVAAVFLAASVTLLLAEGGEFAAEAVEFAANAPLVVSNLLASVLGYFGFGGGVPGWLAWIPGIEAFASLLAGIGPMAYLFVTLVILGVAYGARERIQDTREQIERERERRREAQDEVDTVREAARNRVTQLTRAIQGGDD